jgi:hypothetical protein
VPAERLPCRAVATTHRDDVIPIGEGPMQSDIGTDASPRAGVPVAPPRANAVNAASSHSAAKSRSLRPSRYGWSHQFWCPVEGALASTCAMCPVGILRAPAAGAAASHSRRAQVVAHPLVVQGVGASGTHTSPRATNLDSPRTPRIAGGLLRPQATEGQIPAALPRAPLSPLRQQARSTAPPKQALPPAAPPLRPIRTRLAPPR